MDLASTDRLLTTTRSVRKRLDFTRPVERAVIERCIEIALQAPTGGNQQGWHFVVVTDAAKRRALADLYRKGWQFYVNLERPPMAEDDPRTRQLPRIVDSAQYLTDHFHEAPVMIVPCIEGRVETLGVFAQASTYGSILPAVWSLMLALRSRGLGSAWTSIHLLHEREAAELLGIPEHVTQVALLPVAYFSGEDFKPAKRLPAAKVLHWDGWSR
ncbi:MAG: nitroreductase family protein [Thermodesulfobacteriota bacterium]